MGFDSVDLYLGEGKDYFSQRNNTLFPGSTCNVTAMIQALHLLGYDVYARAGQGVQPEDSLEEMTENPRVYAQRTALKLDPGCMGVPNRQIHLLLSLATDLWIGRPVSKFTTQIDTKAILGDLVKKRPTVLSTTFTPAGHVVCVSGFRTKQGGFILTDPSQIDMNLLEGFYIDDPWGDYMSGYKNQNGKKSFIPKETWLSNVRETGSMTKWGHVFFEPSKVG